MRQQHVILGVEDDCYQELWNCFPKVFKKLETGHNISSVLIKITVAEVLDSVKYANRWDADVDPHKREK